MLSEGYRSYQVWSQNARKSAREKTAKNWLGVISIAVVLIFTIFTVAYTVPNAAIWAEEANVTEAEIYTTMVLLVMAVTVLSLLPVITLWAFDHVRKNTVLKEAEFELVHYKMKTESLWDEIQKRFGDAQQHRHYYVPILLSSLAITLGWSIFFFGNGMEVIEQLAEKNISIVFSRLAYADPVVFGFLGAFCYSLWMLMRRFFSGDINPSVFLHIGIRTWIVVIFTAVIGAIWTWTGRGNIDAPAPQALLAVSFVIGILPGVGFDVIKKLATPVTGGAKIGNPFSNASLDKIPGLNIWRQARLEEENIDSIPSLATCDVVGLIANTRLGVRKILHWVDQAILIVHVGEDNFAKFLSAGICSATALEAAYAGQAEKCSVEEAKKQPDRVTYLGCKDITSLCPTPEDLGKSLIADEGGEWPARLRTLTIAICDDVNYQRLFDILHGREEGKDSGRLASHKTAKQAA